MCAANPKRTIQAPGVMKAKPGHKSKSGRTRLSSAQWTAKKTNLLGILLDKHPELNPSRIEQLAELEMRKRFRPK